MTLFISSFLASIPLLNNLKIESTVFQDLQQLGEFFNSLVGWVSFKDKDVGLFDVEARWSLVKRFFTDTLPGWARSGWDSHVSYFTVTVPGWSKKGWNTLQTFFESTIPNWVRTGWNLYVWPFLTQTVPGWITGGWASVKSFFTETIPEWIGMMVDKARNLWNEFLNSISFGFLGNTSSPAVTPTPTPAATTRAGTGPVAVHVNGDIISRTENKERTIVVVQEAQAEGRLVLA